MPVTTIKALLTAAQEITRAGDAASTESGDHADGAVAQLPSGYPGTPGSSK